jgi:hypothetical protein
MECAERMLSRRCDTTPCKRTGDGTNLNGRAEKNVFALIDFELQIEFAPGLDATGSQEDVGNTTTI